mmetsp:Transcript_4419/g.5110  ORF Transcript_4419/g.5110 Transcript_4419/m.5110 type:complete len:503 (-) Transcript_4419:100-1608(-)
MISAITSTLMEALWFPLLFVKTYKESVAIYYLAIAGILYLIYASYIFTIWEKNFATKRLPRSCKDNPSNKQPPLIKTWQYNKERTLQNSKEHKNFDGCELLHDLKDLKMIKKKNEAFRAKVERTNSLTPGKIIGKGSLSNDLAKELNMDHIYVDFFSLLWAYTFIGPFSYLLWKSGTVWLQIRQILVKNNILKMKPFDIDKVIGKLCLEQSQVIHYYAKTKKNSKLGNIAGFFFADFPYIDQDSKYQVAKLFAVDIDLNTKKFVKAKFDDIHLTASETLILLWFNTIAAQHVKLHSLANWGVNLDKAVKETNPFLHQNSIVTTIYNFFGYSCFKTFMEGWEKQGLLAAGFDENSLIDCFNHGIEDNIWQHPNITDLMQHSKFVNFIVKVRTIFFKEFAKHKDIFPGVHGEAMFVGTVLHSLDHTLMEWNLEDPLWLDVEDPRFGIMAQIGRIVRVGFVNDVPLLYFHKRFKGSRHPFYEAIYRKAARIDKKLADNMDTCIIK